jgi:hypothetical protein
LFRTKHGLNTLLETQGATLPRLPELAILQCYIFYIIVKQIRYDECYVNIYADELYMHFEFGILLCNKAVDLEFLDFFFCVEHFLI